jgi:hypothetical protein
MLNPLTCNFIPVTSFMDFQFFAIANELPFLAPLHHSPSSRAFSQAFLGLTALKMFQKNNRQDSTISVQAMRLLKKIEKDPALRIRDCRNDISRVGPIIMARMNGAISKSSFRKT